MPVCGEDNAILADETPLLLDGTHAQSLLTQAYCTVLLGNYRGHTCFALGLAAGTILPVDSFILTSLRPQFGVLEHSGLALLGYARAMCHWHALIATAENAAHRRKARRAGHELHCTRCGNILYPRVNPAIIVLVTHGNRCLLGRQSPGNRYSTLAGFVEPGESLEAALRREVREETNIRVVSMHYLASQPWPYPASLMLGFHALAENTDIRCNDGELADARWFTRIDIAHGLRNGSLSLSTPSPISYLLLREWFDAGSKTALVIRCPATGLISPVHEQTRLPPRNTWTARRSRPSAYSRWCGATTG